MTDASTTGAVERLAPYAVDGGCDAYGQMESDPFGDYVSYEAYQALVAERDAAIQRAEAAEADQDRLRDAYIDAQVSCGEALIGIEELQKDLTEARAQAALVWEAGRDAAAADVAHFGRLFLINGDNVTVDIRRDLAALTPPADLSAALTARLDAEWAKGFERGVYWEFNEPWPLGDPDRIRALRRAAPTEGEA